MNGGAGGDGSVTVNNIAPELNYEEKEIILQPNETYQIDLNKLGLVNKNPLQEYDTYGDIAYEILDTNIAEIDALRIITAKTEGHTKLKITDTTHNIETYIYIKVNQGTVPQIATGTNFTIALKKNGTVWSYGKGDLGELGTGKNDDTNIPEKIENLSNIAQISAGNSHVVALSETGEIYTWGLNSKGQLGNGENKNYNTPVKVDGLKNIIKVNAYKDISLALDKDGKVYIWGEGYSSFPMKLVTQNKFADISGDLLLSTEGFIYNIEDLENRVNELTQISKISKGTEHAIALSVYGYAYTFGKDSGNGELIKRETITEHIAKNVYEIVAGEYTTFVKLETDEVLRAGHNANGKIGLGSIANTDKLTKIDIGKKIEVISRGLSKHTGIASEEGTVYMTGTGTKGELGNEQNINLTTYTKIGKNELEVEKDTYYMDIGETQEIKSILKNAFNLKIDGQDEEKTNFTYEIADTEKFSINNTNEVTALDYGKTKLEITHKITGISREVTLKVIKKMNDIIQGIRDSNLSDGEYEILVNDEIYNIELYNYYEDVTYTKDQGEIQLGNDTPDQTMLVVKYHKNLTIEEGVKLTAKTRKKGMYICVLGDIVNQGEITMSKKRSISRRRTKCIFVEKY